MTCKELIETLRYMKFCKVDKDSAEWHALDLAIKVICMFQVIKNYVGEVELDEVIEEAENENE